METGHVGTHKEVERADIRRLIYPFFPVSMLTKANKVAKAKKITETPGVQSSSLNGNGSRNTTNTTLNLSHCYQL